MHNQTPIVRMKKQDIVLKLGNETAILNPQEASNLQRDLQTRLHEHALKKHRSVIEWVKQMELWRETETVELNNWYKDMTKHIDEVS